MARRHHVISSGYQRGWADGKRLMLVDKEPRWARMVGVKDAFVEAGFNSRLTSSGDDEELELEWARLEQAAVPHVRRVGDGGSLDERADMEIKTMIAMHFARSYALRDMFEEQWAPHESAPLFGMNRDRLNRAWQRDHSGCLPSDEEILAVVTPRMREYKASNTFLVGQMVKFHNQLVDHLRDMHLQLITAPPGPVEFIFGDEPVIRVADMGLRLRVAILDADGVYFPIGRHRAVTVTTNRESDIDCSRVTVVQLNRLAWRAARRQVAHHPAASWDRSVGL